MKTFSTSAISRFPRKVYIKSDLVTGDNQVPLGKQKQRKTKCHFHHELRQQTQRETTEWADRCKCMLTSAIHMFANWRPAVLPVLAVNHACFSLASLVVMCAERMQHPISSTLCLIQNVFASSYLPIAALLTLNSQRNRLHSSGDRLLGDNWLSGWYLWSWQDSHLSQLTVLSQAWDKTL